MNINRRNQRASLNLLVAAVTIGLAAVVRPLLGALLWACVFAILFHPMEAWLRCRLRGRKNAAASITLLVALLLVLCPIGGVAVGAYQEVQTLVARLDSGHVPSVSSRTVSASDMPRLLTRAGRVFGLTDAAAVEAKVRQAIGDVGAFAAKKAVALGANAVEFALSAAVMVYVMYFLLRDGVDLVSRIRDIAPLHQRHKRELIDKFEAVIKATVRGNLVVAMVQGALGAIIFAVLGVSNPLLSGAAMAAFALLPAAGPAFVWGPVAVYLFLSGNPWTALALTIAGAALIGVVDNVLRPLLVGRGTRMPDWLVLISTIGGISVLGMNGFVIGPLIAGLFITSWSMYADSSTDEQS